MVDELRNLNAMVAIGSLVAGVKWWHKVGKVIVMVWI
jgi:hypothetical protein